MWRWNVREWIRSVERLCAIGWRLERAHRRLIDFAGQRDESIVDEAVVAALCANILTACVWRRVAVRITLGASCTFVGDDLRRAARLDQRARVLQRIAALVRVGVAATQRNAKERRCCVVGRKFDVQIRFAIHHCEIATRCFRRKLQGARGWSMNKPTNNKQKAN